MVRRTRGRGGTRTAIGRPGVRNAGPVAGHPEDAQTGPVHVRVTPGSHLTVALRWDDGDVQTVGRLGHRDRIVYLEYDDSFLTSGLELSPIRHAATRGLVRPYDASVFGRVARGVQRQPARQLGSTACRPACPRTRHRPGDVDAPRPPRLRRRPGHRRVVLRACRGCLGRDRLGTGPRQAGHQRTQGPDGDVSTVVSELGRVGGSPGGARPKAWWP